MIGTILPYASDRALLPEPAQPEMVKASNQPKGAFGASNSGPPIQGAILDAHLGIDIEWWVGEKLAMARNFIDPVEATFVFLRLHLDQLIKLCPRRQIRAF